MNAQDLLRELKNRRDVSANYRSLFTEGNTIRYAIDPNKPITELAWPEFYDVSLGTKCGGGCAYCYAGASNTGVHYNNIVDRIYEFFGTMKPEDRPYQVACGGSSDPMEHPDWRNAMKAFVDLGIVPNITTHSKLVPHYIDFLKEWVGGVAVSLHPHLESVWRKSIKLLHDSGIKVNAHFVYSDQKSIQQLGILYKELFDCVDYFVLLPYMNTGRGVINPKTVCIEELNRVVLPIAHEGKLAFGANAHNWLEQHKHILDIHMHPPELFSKYVHLNETLDVYNNSFDMIKVDFNIASGVELGHVRTNFNF